MNRESRRLCGSELRWNRPCTCPLGWHRNRGSLSVVALPLCLKLRKTWGKQRCMSGWILLWHVSLPAVVCNQEENELLSTRVASFFPQFLEPARVWNVAQYLCPYTLNNDYLSMLSDVLYWTVMHFFLLLIVVFCIHYIRRGGRHSVTHSEFLMCVCMQIRFLSRGCKTTAWAITRTDTRVPYLHLNTSSI